MTKFSQPTTTPPAAAPRSRRGLRIALIVSLMVNVLVIGTLVGGMMRASQFEPPHMVRTDFRALWRAMPDDARAQLRGNAHRHAGPGDRGPRPSREERRARTARLNSDIIDMLRADPFDSAAFVALLGSERRQLEQRLNAAHRAFATQVAELTPEQRQHMAAQLAREWRDQLPD